MPDNRIGQHLEEAVQNNAALREALIAAAYLADTNAKFYLPVLALLYIQREWKILLIIMISMYSGVWDLIPIYHYSIDDVNSYLSGDVVKIQSYLSTDSIDVWSFSILQIRCCLIQPFLHRKGSLLKI